MFLPRLVGTVCMIFSLAVAASLGYAEGFDRKGAVCFFPFENLTQDRDAATAAGVMLRKRLGELGVVLLDDEALHGILVRERVRFRGGVPRALARMLAGELGASYIVTGAVLFSSGGANPGVGLAARLIEAESGRILWANHASATGEDFTGPLGLGKVKSPDELLARVCDRLLGDFGNVVARTQEEGTWRIAVLPFRNRGAANQAGAIVANLFIAELARNPRFTVLEYGDVRDQAIGLRIRNRGELDYRSMEALSGATGADLLLVGTVEQYADGVEDRTPPEVVLQYRIVDARNKRLLWFDACRATGDDDVVAFDWGRIRSTDTTASRAITKLVQRMENAPWL